jgi:hypothetical protein
MREKVLLDKISNKLKEICEINNIQRVSRLSVVVNTESDIDESSLKDYLQNNSNLIGNWTDLKVEKEPLGEQVVILHNIKGE